jgi:hypothetical protein
MPSAELAEADGDLYQGTFQNKRVLDINCIERFAGSPNPRVADSWNQGIAESARAGVLRTRAIRRHGSSL